jgi:hypothetical protein
LADIEFIRADGLAGIAHGFLTRKGGVSSGPIEGLNVGYGSGEEPALVSENRRLAAQAVLPGAMPVAVHQIHSASCVTVEEAWDDDHRPTADALVTARPGILLGIVTADCAPVLLADADAGVVGAAHAGWRGAANGVIEAVIAAMERLGARRTRIAAAIGPAIAQESYEVGEDFRANFADEDARFFVCGRPGHMQFDLEACVAARLEAAGVGNVERMALDTYADEARFYSYRRSTHRGEPNYGRQFSLIGLT